MAQFPMAVGGGSCSGTTTSNNVTSGVRAVAAAASANTKGAWVELIASTAEDYDAILVHYAAATSNVSYLVDVGIGGAGSEVVIAANIHTSIGNNSSEWFVIPRAIPAGTRISMRCASSTLSSQVRGGIVGVKGGWFTPQGGGDVITYGANAADSGGTPVDAGATANTYGAWAQLTASTGADVKALCVKTGGINNTTPTTGQGLLQIGVGAAASEQPLFEIPFNMGTTIDNYGPMPPFWFPVSVPAGSRLAARVMMTVTDATDRLMDVVAYGLEA